MKRYLTDAEQQQLLQAAKTCTSPLAQRDYWWMRLAINTGMRVTELSLLQRCQAEHAMATGWLVMHAHQRKGGKRGHEYLVTQTVRECLHHLLAMHEAEAPPADTVQGPAPLLWGRFSARLSVRSYQARLQHWAQVAGLGLGVSPHWLRHTRGMNIMRRSRAKSPVHVVQEVLGHASLASTGIYTKMSREEFERDLRAIDGGRTTKRMARTLAQAQQGQQTQGAPA